jgi:LPS-assembly protein
LPSLHVLPLEYPDYNAIDAVDSQNVIRWGLRNRLQTKRNGEVRDVLDWEVFTDWRLDPQAGQTTFGDVVSDLQFHPRTWFSLRSLERYDLDRGQVRLAFNSLTLQPNTAWHLRLGYLYLRDDFSGTPTAWGEGNNLLTSMLYLRLNEEWGLRLAHYYDVRDNDLEEQSYSLYRDFRSWTGALSFRVREDVGGDQEYTVAFTFSLKALPRYRLGRDTIMAEDWLGY